MKLETCISDFFFFVLSNEKRYKIRASIDRISLTFLIFGIQQYQIANYLKFICHLIQDTNFLYYGMLAWRILLKHIIQPSLTKKFHNLPYVI